MSSSAQRSILLLSALLALTSAACAANESNTAASTGSSSGGEAVAAPQGSVVTVDFEAERTTPDDAEVQRMNITLALADETGAVVRVPLGEFMSCDEPTATDNTVLTLSCYWAGTGDAIHITHEGDELVVLHEDLAEELTDAPRTPMRRFRLAPGASVAPLQE